MVGWNKIGHLSGLIKELLNHAMEANNPYTITP